MMREEALYPRHRRNEILRQLWEWSNGSKPLLIGDGRLEVISMPLNAQSRRREDVRKPVAQVTIRKEDNAQAARS
jgi:hypothetical protein